MNHFLSQFKTHAHHKQSNSLLTHFQKISLHPKEPHARSIGKKEKQTARKISLSIFKTSKHRLEKKRVSKVELVWKNSSKCSIDFALVSLSFSPYILYSISYTILFIHFVSSARVERVIANEPDITNTYEALEVFRFLHNSLLDEKIEIISFHVS